MGPVVPVLTTFNTENDHRDYKIHITLLLLNYGNVSPSLIHAAMQAWRPISGRRRRSEGGVHRILPPLGDIAHGVVGAWGGAFGACLGGGISAGILGKRVADRGMCVFSRFPLSSSKQMTDMIGR